MTEEGKRNELAREWAGLYHEFPLSRTNFLKQLICASQLKCKKSSGSKYIFINSLKDKLVNPEASKGLSKYFDAPLYTHPNAGHDLPLDDPQWLSEKILNNSFM
jgi:hypothetical protein